MTTTRTSYPSTSDVPEPLMGPYILLSLSVPFLITGIAAKPSPYRWMFFLPIASLSICIYHSKLQSDTFTAYLAIHLLTASHFLLLTNVQRELRPTGQLEGKSIWEAPFWSRVKWSLKLLATPRGIGWTHQPKHGIPPRPTSSRRRFILTSLGRVLFNIALIDLTKITITHNPSFRRTAQPFAEQTLLWRSWCILQFMAMTVPGLTMMYLSLAVASVALGLSEPADWPDLIGKFGDAYTVRRFWG